MGTLGGRCFKASPQRSMGNGQRLLAPSSTDWAGTMREEKVTIVGIRSFHAENELGVGFAGIPFSAYVQQKHLLGVMEWTVVFCTQAPGPCHPA